MSLLVSAVVAMCAVAAVFGDDEKRFRTCEPGTQVQVNCNTCYCWQDGSGYDCTTKICHQENDIPSSALKEGKDSVASETFDSPSNIHHPISSPGVILPCSSDLHETKSRQQFGNLLSTCANTVNCPNCSNCSNCKNCPNCNKCDNCSNCPNCSNCANCSNCPNCSHCANCSGCIDCSNTANCKRF